MFDFWIFCRLMFLGLPISAMLELNSNLRSVPGGGFFTGDVFSLEICKTHYINFFFVFLVANFEYMCGLECSSNIGICVVL